MRPTPVTLLLLALGAALLGGCSGGTDAVDPGPSVVATGPRTESSSSATASEAPAACAPYSVMVAAIEDAARQTSDPEQIAAAIAPVMKRFAARVPHLPRPPGMSAETWAGVLALAAQIRTLPDHPSNADIEAVEQDLSADDRRAVEAAATWFRSSCGL